MIILFFKFRLAVTKLDVLDDFEEIKIGISYILDGKELTAPPGICLITFHDFIL